MKSGWVTKRLGEIGEIVRGKGIRRNETVAKGKPCLRYGEIYTSFNYILDQPHSFVPETIYNESPHIKRDDVVFSLTGENKEEIAKALAYLGNEEIAAGGDLAIWTNHGCDAKYLSYLMYAPAMIEAKALASNGDIIVHASLKKMQQIPIPLPPLPEQRRIVSKIDAAFEKIDRLKANAEKNLANAKELFQSALNEALRPKKGWVEKRLGEIAEFKNGLNFKRKAGGFKVQLIGVSDFSKTDVVTDRTVLDEIEIEDRPGNDWFLKSNDFVFVRSNGSKKLVGRVILVKTDRQMTFSGFCIRMRLKVDSALPSFLLFQIAPDSFRERLLSSRNSSTINNVTQPILSAMKVWLPPINKQSRIAQSLDFQAKDCAALQSNYTRLIADCAEMKQAVLKDAFEGRL